MTKRVLLWLMTVALLMGSAVPVWAKPAPKPAPNVPAKAGNISALLPTTHIVRGSGRTAVTTDAKKGDELVWNDLVKTEKGGRARITLADQSILSLGSQAELRIVKHDARAQQTAIQMAYGRVRAQVASITRNGGSFELRTPTAVAGVIGTDFGVDSSATGGDTFVCIAGATQISNADPNIPGSVQCSAGQTTTVQPGKSPTAPTPASLQQLQQLIEDTEPAIISSISPAAALPGTNFDSSIAGTRMGKVTSVNVVGGSGVTATIKSTSETSVQIHVVVDPTAPVGPRTLTLTKEAGAASAAVFTVLGTPIGDPKKAYLEILEQMKSTGIGGLGAFLTGAQQAADQVAQQITQANQNLPKPLDLSPFADSLNQQYGVLSNDFKGGTGAIDKAAQDAATTFAGLYDTAYQALLQRDATGTPDATFRNALTAAFTQANTILQTALQNMQTGMNGAVQTYGSQLNTIQQTWSQNINNAFLDQQSGLLPKVNALERIVELGAVTSFDAVFSSASNSSVSITSYQWTLCAHNYQPNGFGQVLPQGTPACNGIQGYISSSSEFQIATCSLQPGSYFARLSVTDSNNKISQMDVKLTVLSPNYPTPGDTVRSLADAYTSLQLSQFLRLFDSAQFNGYTPLSENIRQTMQSLSSMAINLRLSQENVTCNDATVRADWQQNYSFIANPKTVYSQSEQLSVRLQRTPGAGWFISDLQGDNGKVQGVPGPQTTDTAAPDLAVGSAAIDGRPLTVGSPLQVSAGPHAVVVNVTNTGAAALSGSLPVTIALQDTNGSNVTSIGTFTGTVPSPLASGASAPLNATLNFPATANNLSIVVQVNPSCNPPETSCGATNNASYPVILGVPDFNASFVPAATINGIAGRPLSFPAVAVTPSPYPVALTVAYTGLPAGVAAASPANNTTNINGTLISGTPSAAGSSTVAATASAAGTTKNVTGSATISIGSEITITEPTPPTIASGGPAQNLTVNVTGGVYPVTLALTLPTGITTTSGTINGGISTQIITGPGAVTWALSADFTSTAGALQTNIVATDAGIAATATPPGKVIFPTSYTVTGNAIYAITGLTATGHNSPYTQANAFQIGEITTFSVTVKNSGNTSPTGTVDISLDCGNKNFCPTPLTGSAAAPAAGASVTIPISVDFPNFAVGSYNGSAALSTNVAGAQVGGPSAFPFDVVDFTISSNINFTPQNILIGGSGQISVAVATQVPSGPSFPVTITPTPAANLSFVPASASGNGSNVSFTVNVSPSMQPSDPRIGDFITVNAANHGVIKTAKVPIPVNYFSASLISTSLFVNDAASPLNVPVALGTLVPATTPQLQMRVNGNYDTSSGPATLAVQQPGCGTFTVNFDTISVVPNDTPNFTIYANQGTNCPPATPVNVNAAIPQTFPPLSLPVYTLFVNASGLPLLTVVSATPSRDISTSPWLSGEALDWTVVVSNTGSGASSGNDRITFYLDNANAGQTTLPSIPAGQQTTVLIHVVASDLPQDSPPVSFHSFRVHVENDPKGSFDPSIFKDFTSLNPVNIANWGIQVTGNGQFDGDPNFSLSPTTTTLTTTVAISPVTGGFNPNIVLSLVPGVYSSGQLNAPGFSPNTLSSSGASTVTVSYPAGGTPVNGDYFVQVIAQMKDGGTVTAQRQATIHVLMSSQSKIPAGVNLVSDRNNLAACPDGCATPPATVQLNGPLPEAFTLTGSITSCSAGNGCPGNADVTFTDSFKTVTTPPLTTVAFNQTGTSFGVQVKAADNPDGSVNTGSADVNVSVSAIQASFFGAARTPNPDPVGTLFFMKFNIGDLSVGTGGSCFSVPPGATAALAYSVSLDTIGGFNLPSVQWEWQDFNHVQVSGSPLSFGTNSGSSNLSGANGSYPLPTFNLTNNGQGVDGLQTYYFAVTVSNAVATATEYFPVDFDLSTNQKFCPVFLASRGSGAHRIKGSWGKAGLSAPSSLSLARTANGKLPDLRISANDISFTPSVPKAGDKVEVRFRISNVGDANAIGVPVALQVHGNTVAIDTFDVPAGKTILGGLNWTKAEAQAGAVQSSTQRSRANIQARNAARLAKLGIDTPQPADSQSNAAPSNSRGSGGGSRFGLRAQIVIDPQKTIAQKTTLAKSAALAHFDVRDPAADAATMASLGEQHALLILSEGACGGLKIASGAGSCTSADLTFTVEDLAKATYKLESNDGIADLGIGNTSYANASFGMQALLQNGRTYAVQTRGGTVGLVTIRAVRSPQQLSEAAKRLFRNGQAVTIVKSLGGSTDAPETGDTAGRGSDALVYFDITYQGQ